MFCVIKNRHETRTHVFFLPTSELVWKKGEEEMQNEIWKMLCVTYKAWLSESLLQTDTNTASQATANKTEELNVQVA